MHRAHACTPCLLTWLLLRCVGSPACRHTLPPSRPLPRTCLPACLPACLSFALQELQVALKGKGMDPAAGSWTLDPVFEGSQFKFGYLVSFAGPAAALRVGCCGATGMVWGRER